jgi:hypothetical protein
VLAISDGTRYEGEFRHGKRHGQGLATLPGGLSHDGAWVDGEIRGYGKATHPNGDVYEGEFRDFQRHGRGVLVTADGRRVEGEWQAGRFVALAAPSAEERLAAARQACTAQADSCETACAVGALAGALLSRGKSDGTRDNAECAARCGVGKGECLARTGAPASPVASAGGRKYCSPMNHWCMHDRVSDAPPYR